MNTTAPKALNTRLSITLIFAVLVSLIMTTTASATDYVVKAREQNGETKTGLTIFSVDVGANYPVYGLMNANGDIVIPANYLDLKYAGENRIIAEDRQWNRGIITTTGAVIYPFNAREIEVVNEENPIFSVKRYPDVDFQLESEALYGLYDWNGNQLRPMAQGLCYHLGGDYFCIGGYERAPVGIYQQGVGDIIPCKYKSVKYLGDDLFAVQNDVGDCCVIDRSGNQILPFSYEYIDGHAKGAFIVAEFTDQGVRESYRKYGTLPDQGEEEFLCGLVDIHGDILFPMIYDRIILNEDGPGKAGTWNGQYTYSAAIDEASPPRWKSLDYEPFDIKDLVSIPAGPSSGFTDVKSSNYYADAVQWAVEKNITSGTSKTTFSPNSTCTNTQILAFLYLASGSPEPPVRNPFADVKATDYYYKAAL